MVVGAERVRPLVVDAPVNLLATPRTGFFPLVTLDPDKAYSAKDIQDDIQIIKNRTGAIIGMVG